MSSSSLYGVSPVKIPSKYLGWSNLVNIFDGLLLHFNLGRFDSYPTIAVFLKLPFRGQFFLNYHSEGIFICLLLIHGSSDDLLPILHVAVLHLLLQATGH